jgi:hypothetical protein
MSSKQMSQVCASVYVLNEGGCGLVDLVVFFFFVDWMKLKALSAQCRRA